jgi:hypothetical protein
MSEQGWTIVGHIATFLKYSFTAATTALSVVSLRHDTTYKSNEPNAIRELTRVGRYYMAGVIALAAISIATTIVGDVANSRLDRIKKEKAQAELNRVLQGQLDKQLQQGIKPVLHTLGEDVARQSKAVLQDLEQQAEASASKLQIAQGHLLAQTQQSSQKLTALDSGMEASAGLSRELLDRQQRLAEASSQVTYLAAVVTVPLIDPATSKAPSLSIASNVRKAIFHGSPDIQTHLIVSLQYGDLSVEDIPCSSGTLASATAPGQDQVSPCLHAAGKMDYRLGPTGGVVMGFPFEITMTNKNVAPRDADSALLLAADPIKLSQANPPLRARDMENTGIFLTLCVARDGHLAESSSGEQEAALRHADETLPARLDIKLTEMLRPLESGSEYSAIHSYTYVRATNRPSQFTQGCLHPFYRVSF